jgi:hypothetical protein
MIAHILSLLLSISNYVSVADEDVDDAVDDFIDSRVAFKITHSSLCPFFQPVR